MGKDVCGCIITLDMGLSLCMRIETNMKIFKL